MKTILYFLFLTGIHLSAQTLNQSALDSLSIACKKSRSESFSVLYEGKIITNYSLNKQKTTTAAYSVLKSIAALAIGKLIEENKIKSIDQPVSDLFPQWKQLPQSRITIRHLMNHTSGIEESGDYFNAGNVVQYALNAKLIETPGTVFRYNTEAFLLLLGVIEKASGIKTCKYIEQRIFNPLGITDFTWDHDSASNVKELFTTSFELVKIGQLVLNNGNWNNKKIIPGSWIDEMLTPSQPFVPNYGLLWWLIPEHTYYIVDDRLLEDFKKAGIKQDLIEKFKSLKGRYLNVNIPEDKLKIAFGEGWNAYLEKEFYPFFPTRSKREFSKKIIGYKAEGYLGQYIIIFPAKKLIATRMVRKTEQYEIQTDEMLGFEWLVDKLIK